MNDGLRRQRTPSMPCVLARARGVGPALAVLLCVAATGTAARAQSPGTEAVTRLSDIPFARAGGSELMLDLYLPADAASPPLLVFVHGGGWSRGSRKNVPTLEFVEAGYALASVGYRLSTVAPFPAQIHDVKAAIRFLRANAPAYGYDARRVGLLGVSAGAHLAALAALTHGNAELEGAVGEHGDASSEVQAVASYFGASNLETILAQSTPRGLAIREPALERLLGGAPESRPRLAALASPVNHVDADDPPLLLMHGDQDPQMPINQSHELDGAYGAHGLTARFHVIHGAGHGGPRFFDAEHVALALEFFDEHLRPAREAASRDGVADSTAGG